MPLYDIQCGMCKHEYEENHSIKSVDTHDGFYICPKCNSASGKIQITNSKSKEAFNPHWNPNFGVNPVFVKSKRHYKSLCKEHDVISRAEGDFRNYYETLDSRERGIR